MWAPSIVPVATNQTTVLGPRVADRAESAQSPVRALAAD